MHPRTGGSAAVVLPGGDELVLLDHGLAAEHRRAERRVALGHEVTHLERGLLPADAPAALLAAEEARVRAEVVRRMVPVDELRAWAAELAELGPVTAHDVAEEFGVTIEVAIEACRRAA